MLTNTKIIATIGPACDNKETLQAMVDAGVGTFRVNMSHGDSVAKQKMFDLTLSALNEIRIFNNTKRTIKIKKGTCFWLFLLAIKSPLKIVENEFLFS